MNFNRIEIQNFRSIKDATIKFNHNCLILLGKNEAGKSNILKAIAAVFGKYEISDRDKRKKIDNEKIKDTEYYVRCVFSLTEHDFKMIEERFVNKYGGTENLKFSSGISLKEFISKVFSEFLIKIEIKESSKPYYQYWKYSNKKDIELTQPIFVSKNNFIIESGTAFELENLLFNEVKEYYIENQVNCHYWRYNDDLLLPSVIDIETFTDSPSSFKSLENIFHLCGRENIEKEFANAKSEDGDYSNLLDQVSKSATKTFQKIWEDFKGTSIQLLPDGDQILIKIVNKAKYNCEDRSDGFKKFISILLMLSTQSRANKMKGGDLVLIDEPDQSLYPTSVRYLRNELLTIAEKSMVIFSTHSQYMIDPSNLDRHIVVEKKDDITTLYKEDANAPYTTDELLKRAIGASVFECLKQINIVFEGYLDKILFEKYCNWHKKENAFINYGKIYLKGISGIDCIVAILDAANKKFIVVADSDTVSVAKRKDFEKEHPEYKNDWLAYADVINTISTMEDFFTEDIIASEIKKFKNDYEYDTSKNAIQNIEKAIGKEKENKQNIKNNIIENIKKDNIKEDYGNYIEELKKRLNIL